MAEWEGRDNQQHGRLIKYKDKHASIHVVNVLNTYKHNMVYIHDTYKIGSG